jgi:hypothetical protein
MKTSTKILTVVAGVVIVFFLTGLFMVRSHLIHYLSRTETEKYKTVSTDTFTTIHLSAKWDVAIRPGKQFKVQIVNADTTLRPEFENVNGTLYLRYDSTNDTSNPHSIHARIIAPSLRSIFSQGESRINIEGFTTDSLNVTIDGSTFTGKGNKFKFVSFKSSGNAHIELTEVPDF